MIMSGFEILHKIQNNTNLKCNNFTIPLKQFLSQIVDLQ